MIIVIDGPAGSGKSTTAKAVANRLNIEYIDSGALYRTATLIYAESESKEAFIRLLQQKEITFRYHHRKFHVKIDGVSVTDKLRTPEVEKHVSEVAAMPQVRAFVNDLMRSVISQGVYIAEGRDLGTAVFPDAALKFFMIADLDERARRRYEDQKHSDPTLTLEKVKQSIARRDRKDSERETDPLTKAEDAIEINTTNLTFEEQVDEICRKVKQQIDL
jgi:cytidylate kinase